MKICDECLKSGVDDYGLLCLAAACQCGCHLEPRLQKERRATLIAVREILEEDADSEFIARVLVPGIRCAVFVIGRLLEEDGGSAHSNRWPRKAIEARTRAKPKGEIHPAHKAAKRGKSEGEG